MKKLLSILLATLLLFSLTACAGNESATSEQTQGQSSESEQTQTSTAKTAEELAEIIVSTRSEDENSGLSVIAGDENGMQTPHNPLELTEEDLQMNAEMILQSAAFDIENCESYAFSVAGTMVNAYGVGIFYPKEGAEQSVKESLEGFVLQKQSDFENYLPDQYEVAQNGIVEQTSSGALILVVAPNASEVFSAIDELL